MSKLDVKIWERILSGETVAWEELVEKYARLVFSIGLRAGLSKSEAEDCSQQVWMTLFNNRAKIQNPEQLYSWLISTTQRKAWRLIKRRDKAEEIYKELPPKTPIKKPDEQFEQLLQKAQMQEALDRLGGRCAKLLRAIFFAPEQLSYQEISQALGIPFNSIGPTRARCLKKLEKILEEMEGD